MNSRHLTDITNTQQGTYIDNFPFPVRKTFPQKLNTRKEKVSDSTEVPMHFAPYNQPNLLPASQHMSSHSILIMNKEENKSEKSVNRGRWTEEEDNILKSIIKKVGNTNDWHRIANAMPKRNAKQCRERWANYLDPSINRSEWTEEEDRIIIEGVKEHGKCWGKISTKLKGRPNNAIKNRFNTVIRKKYKYIEKENVNTEIKNEIKETKIRTILPRLHHPIQSFNPNYSSQNLISDNLIYNSVNQTMLPFYKEMVDSTNYSYNQFMNFNDTHTGYHHGNVYSGNFHNNATKCSINYLPNTNNYNAKFDNSIFNENQKVPEFYNANFNIPNDFPLDDGSSLNSDTSSLKNSIITSTETSNDTIELNCNVDQNFSLYCEEKAEFLEQQNDINYLDLGDENVQKVIDSLKDLIELDKYQASDSDNSFNLNQLEDFSLTNFYESQM